LLGRHMQQTICNGPLDSKQHGIITKKCAKAYTIFSKKKYVSNISILKVKNLVAVV